MTWRKLIAISIGAISVAFFTVTMVKNLDVIPIINRDRTTVIVAAASLVLSFFASSLGGVIWYLLLRSKQGLLHFKEAQIIYLISQFGKYLPGNVGQHVGRVVMARNIGIPASLTLSNVFIEMFWSAGIGAGLTLLPMLFMGTRSLGGYWPINPLLLAGGVMGLLLLPWLAIHLLKKLFPDLARRLSGGHDIKAPTLTMAIVIAGLFVMSFFSLGLILKIQAEYFFGATNINLLEMTSSFAAAWLAGYIVPGAPGGLGVRESMMVVLLSPSIGSGAAVGLGVTLRLTTTAGDAVAFAVGLISQRRFTRR